MPKLVLLIPEIFFGTLFIYGLLNAIFPKQMWKLFESWKATHEPTKTFFVVRRVLGICEMLIVLVIFLVPYMISHSS